MFEMMVNRKCIHNINKLIYIIFIYLYFIILYIKISKKLNNHKIRKQE